jgi:hypothetical protein
MNAEDIYMHSERSTGHFLLARRPVGLVPLS